MAVTDIELPLLVENGLARLGRLFRVDVRHNTLQVLDVVLTVESFHLIYTGSVRLIDVKFLVQAVAKYELVRHLHP